MSKNGASEQDKTEAVKQAREGESLDTGWFPSREKTEDMRQTYEGERRQMSREEEREGRSK